ncbi:hypothetical protein ACUXAV_000414 [Cupriavidus metallidurans]|nr:hypothetical protein [Cupriavidus metallidurans]MDE4918372.1 hypothetical protein [Cupriavidus metallidurans]
MIDLDDPIIRRARNNRRLLLATLAGIGFVAAVVILDIARQL